MVIYEGRPFNGVYTGENVEEQVQSYMAHLNDYTKGQPVITLKKKYEKVEVPENYNCDLQGELFASFPVALQEKIGRFWEEQAKKCKEGEDELCGLSYGYYNFAKLRGGRGDTALRRNDNELFKLIDSCMNGDNDLFVGNKRKGVIEVGRRRSGKSSKLSWFIIFILWALKDIDVLVTSKTEEDAKRVIMQEKIQFMYMNLPIPLKPKCYKMSGGELHLAVKKTDESGNIKMGGRNSKVVAKPPKSTALEGSTPTVWAHDEAPKTNDFLNLFNMTEPALADAEGLVREGFIYVTGVAGDFDEHGEDYKTLWKNAEARDLIRWFSPGWAGFNCDEYGNEDIEANVRFILEKRHKVFHNKKLNAGQRQKEMIDLQQQYPLTVEESFLVGAGGKFPVQNINAQLNYLEEHVDEHFLDAGSMMWQVPGIKATFIPDQLYGKLTVLERPKVGFRYVGGIDSFGLKQTDVINGSNGAFWVLKLENTKLSPLELQETMIRYATAVTYKDKLALALELGNTLVAYYEDMPRDPKEFAEQAAMIATWYTEQSAMDGPMKVLIETLPAAIMEHFLEKYPDYVMNAPIIPGRTHSNQYLTERFGIDMKAYWTDIRLSETAHYLLNYCDRVYFIKLLNKLKTYDETTPEKKYDVVDAFGIVLVCSKDPRVKEWNKHMPKVEEEKDIWKNGIMGGWKRSGYVEEETYINDENRFVG